MSLYEPLLGLLPADESEILSINPRVHPDALLTRLRRLERFGAVRRRKDGKYVQAEPPKDDAVMDPEAKQKIAEARKVLSRSKRPKMPNGVRINPINESQLRSRVCPCCQEEYVGISQHFGNSRNKYCKGCRQKLGY